MSESRLWKTTRDNLKPFGRLKRIENLLEEGTPDVSYTLRRKPVLPASSGWCELKFLPYYPKRPQTLVRIDHLTLDQVNWLNAEADAGGRAWLLLHAAPYYLMLTPAQARRVYKVQYRADELLADTWTAENDNEFPLKRILTCLTN